MAFESEKLDPYPLLRERYGYLRTEILQRMDNRYKILTATLTLITIGFTVIYQLKWDSISVPICAFLLAMAVILQGENKHICIISNYMIEIEKQLDAGFRLYTPGWETYSRQTKYTKRPATSLLFYGALLFSSFFYLIFAFIAIKWAATKISAFIIINMSILYFELFLISVTPLAAVCLYVHKDFNEFFAEKRGQPNS